METTLPSKNEDEAEKGEFSTIRITRKTRAGLDRLTRQLKASSLDALLTFFVHQYEGSTHLNTFFDLRELVAVADRLHAVLLLLATTNLELGQHLRRAEAGYYRRLAQYADELVALQNRIIAERNGPALTPKI